METLRVLLPASSIKDGTTVTKRNGTKEYVLTREIKIYGGKEPQIIKAEKGACFLVSGDGSANAHPETTLFLCEMDRWEILELFEGPPK